MAVQVEGPGHIERGAALNQECPRTASRESRGLAAADGEQPARQVVDVLRAQGKGGAVIHRHGTGVRDRAGDGAGAGAAVGCIDQQHPASLVGEPAAGEIKVDVAKSSADGHVDGAGVSQRAGYVDHAGDAVIAEVPHTQNAAGVDGHSAVETAGAFTDVDNAAAGNGERRRHGGAANIHIAGNRHRGRTGFAPGTGRAADLADHEIKPGGDGGIGVGAERRPGGDQQRAGAGVSRAGGRVDEGSAAFDGELLAGRDGERAGMAERTRQIVGVIVDDDRAAHMVIYQAADIAISRAAGGVELQDAAGHVVERTARANHVQRVVAEAGDMAQQHGAVVVDHLVGAELTVDAVVADVGDAQNTPAVDGGDAGEGSIGAGLRNLKNPTAGDGQWRADSRPIDLGVAGDGGAGAALVAPGRAGAAGGSENDVQALGDGTIGVHPESSAVCDKQCAGSGVGAAGRLDQAAAAIDGELFARGDGDAAGIGQAQALVGQVIIDINHARVVDRADKRAGARAADGGIGPDLAAHQVVQHTATAHAQDDVTVGAGPADGQLHQAGVIDRAGGHIETAVDTIIADLLDPQLTAAVYRDAATELNLGWPRLRRLHYAAGRNR